MRNYKVTYQICQTTVIKPNVWVIDNITKELFMVTDVNGDKLKGSKFAEFTLIENVLPIELGLKPMNRYGETKPSKKKMINIFESEYSKWVKEQTYCDAIFIPFNINVYADMSAKIGTVLQPDSPYLLSTFKNVF